LFKCDRAAFWLLVVIIIADLAYAVGYDIAEDKDAYYLPAFVALAVAAGVGLRWIISLVARQSAAALKTSLVAALALVMPIIAFAGNWPFNNRRNYFIAHDYVENLLRPIETGGLLVTFDWQVASPMFYTQQIEQLREDAKIIDLNLLRRSWYFDYLRRSY